MTYSKSITGGGEIGLMLSGTVVVVVVVIVLFAPFFNLRDLFSELVQLCSTDDDDVITILVYLIVIKPIKTGIATLIAVLYRINPKIERG